MTQVFTGSYSTFQKHTLVSIGQDICFPFFFFPQAVGLDTEDSGLARGINTWWINIEK